MRGDCSATAFAGYIEGRRGELETSVAYLRHVLHHLRDRDALLRAAHDDSVRAEIFGALFADVTDRGRLVA